jgi:hypothetical protein
VKDVLPAIRKAGGRRRREVSILAACEIFDIENEGKSHDIVDNKGPNFLSHDVIDNKDTYAVYPTMLMMAKGLCGVKDLKWWVQTARLFEGSIANGPSLGTTPARGKKEKIFWPTLECY